MTKTFELCEVIHHNLSLNYIFSSGIIFTNGHMWKQQRRFALFTLKYFGVGKKSLEFSILDEFTYLTKELAKHKGRTGNAQNQWIWRCSKIDIEIDRYIWHVIPHPGKPFNPHFIVNNAVSNIISTLVFGHRFEYSDEKFLNMMKLIDRGTKIEGSFWAQVRYIYIKSKHFDLYFWLIQSWHFAFRNNFFQGILHSVLLLTLTAVQRISHPDEACARPAPHSANHLLWNVRADKIRTRSAQERLGPLRAQGLHRLLPEWDSEGEWKKQKQNKKGTLYM